MSIQTPVAAAAPIELEDVRFAYAEWQALAGISLSVAAGEIVGLLGPNGAGKSTAIKLLTGQLEPESGRISLMGRDAAHERDVVQHQIGVTFERQNLYEDMTTTENWSCLSFVDAFTLWSEGVYDAEESTSLPAGAAA